MGVEGMVVKPAGAVEDGSGHHHIIIDSDPIPNGMIVPADEQHKHFGKGQTETELTLAPGEYNIQLQFANGVHLSYGKNLNTDITIFVSDGSDTENAEPSTKSGTTEKTKAPPAPAKSTIPQKNNKAAE